MSHDKMDGPTKMVYDHRDREETLRADASHFNILFPGNAPPRAWLWVYPAKDVAMVDLHAAIVQSGLAAPRALREDDKRNIDVSVAIRDFATLAELPEVGQLVMSKMLNLTRRTRRRH